MKIIIAETKEDKDKALEIRRTVFTDEQGVPESMEIDEYEQSSIHFLAYSNDEAVATGRFRIKKSYLKFERIATLKNARGKGIGKALMQFMQDHAFQNYPEYLPAMHAQESAISFYEQIGWMGVGDRYDEARIWHQTMIFPPKEIEKLKALEDPETNPAILELLNNLRKNNA